MPPKSCVYCGGPLSARLRSLLSLKAQYMAPPAAAANGIPSPAPKPAFAWLDDGQESGETWIEEVGGVAGEVLLAAAVEFGCRLPLAPLAPRPLVSLSHPGASWKRL